ncbi:MAG: RHS repeat-associated core domain-containing protein [Terracidiphilus sp.]|nr:RHS repeat-associated core domain-containing protein [Terracidiphilus sp.]
MSVTDTYEYDALGNKINSTGTTPNNYLYRGEMYDSDLGRYYLRARYYNPLTGRFMSRDPEDGIPTDPKTLHKYMYAGGDPVNATDPTGKGFVEDAFARVRLGVRTAIEGTRLGESTLCIYRFLSDVTLLTAVGFYHGNPINQNLVLAYDDLRVCLALSGML